ncbi:MAG: GNAT family N-acetyltransferase, partial [Pseudomonadales bacterium]
MEVRAASATEFRQYIRWLEQTASWMEAQGIEQRTVDSFKPRTGMLEQAWRRGELVITLDGDLPIAGALLTPSPSVELERLWIDVSPTNSETTLYLQNMVLAPDLRDTGRGREVLGALEDAARALNCSCVRLDCVANNQFLPRFYQDAGYFPRGERKLSGATVLRLDKDLDAAHELMKILPGWQADLVGTLLFVIQDGKVLLIRKKRGH